MNILFIYPKYPDSFWSFKHALRFISKKAAVPPLGLITVSAMLPSNWQKKLVDLNVAKLKAKDIEWADYVFISAMHIQRESVTKIVEECKNNNTKIVAGGPLFTQEYNDFPQIDHFVLNEAEITLPHFLKDIEDGLTPQRVYKTKEFADIKKTPVPDYYLLSRKDYANMNIQVSRGCPFACDFCEITSLLGHKVRIKETRQIIKELDALYNLNWRGPVSIVDDNFAGNKNVIMNDLLPAMKKWMDDHKHPFVFSIQVSIEIADNDRLLSLMAQAGFASAFIGIETPDKISLKGCNKVQNNGRDLLLSVEKLQKAGLHVSGGFIVGFDSDEQNIFQRQIEFIQKSGIVSAMVGLLNAPKNTKLYNRLKAEDRLITVSSGNNTDFSLNFKPVMDYDELMTGYKSIIKNIYDIKPYYKRVRHFLSKYERRHKTQKKVEYPYLMAFLKTIVILGIISKGRIEYWKTVFWTLFKRPALFMDAITYAVYGYHYRTVFGLKR